MCSIQDQENKSHVKRRVISGKDDVGGGEG